MSFVKYWGIQITVNKEVHSLPDQQWANEMWVGPHVRLTGMSGMAHIVSKNLAEQYLHACIPVFDKRYKDGFEACIKEWEESSNKQLMVRLDMDSRIIQERIKTGNMAPNNKTRNF